MIQKQEEQLKKRFVELANKAYHQNIYTYTGFLNMMELNIFFDTVSFISHIPFQVFGGEEFCERQMVGFGSIELLGYESSFPINCIHIYPVLAKFSNTLTHRDFLGALLNLGIERSIIGDIFVKENQAYAFCQESMTKYIVDNLERVHHTTVKTKVVEMDIANDWKPALANYSVPVSSLRLDVIIAAVYHLSRSQSLECLQEKRVFVNGRLNQNPSHLLQEGDLISLRGQGRFWFTKTGGMTKKGRCYITIEKYV